MNLLVLSTWFPYPPDNGSRLRAFHLIRELSASHRIRLVAGLQQDLAEVVSEDRIPAALAEICDEVVTVPWKWFEPDPGTGAIRALLSMTPRSVAETDNPALREAVVRALRKPTDAVLALELGMAPFVPGAVPVPVVLEQVEVSGMEQACRAARGAVRLRHRLTTWKARRYWRRALRRYAALTVVSEEEAAAVRHVLGPTPGGPAVEVVPNGVAVSSYRKRTTASHRSDVARVVPGRLIYNGSLSYAPNLDAVRWFAAEILPRIVLQVPEAHLVVTGRDPGATVDDLRANPRVCFTGFVPDLRPELEKAALCVVPLRAGGGTRLKILEAFAAELPVVSTRIGAAGLKAEHGEHLLLADTPDAMAGGVVQLLQDPERAAVIARRARRLAEERYDWSRSGADLSDLLVRLTSLQQTHGRQTGTPKR
jgi:glycosyltransferase involved in cell wall biosynthesis